MISTIRCCKNCVERTAGCHSRCELYQKEKGEFESMKEAERKVKNKRFNPFYQYKKLVLKICGNLSDLELKLSNIEIRFTRRNYENISEKANVLTTMLANPKIAPILAFTHSGLFSDPQIAYKVSMEYYEEQARKVAEIAAQNNGGDNADANLGDGGNDQRNSQKPQSGGSEDRER